MAILIRGLPTAQFMGDDELPLALGKIYTYNPGTTTNKATYQDKDGTNAHANPIVLDAEGRAEIWWNGIYDIVIKDANDNTIDTVDNYGAGESATTSGTGTVLNGSFEDGVTTPDDWTLTTDSGGTVAIETTDVNHGDQALKFTSTGSGGGTATSSFIQVYPGEQLLVDFQLKCSVVDIRNLVEVLWFDKAQASVSNTTLYDESAANPTSWTTKQGSATAPATATFAKIKIHGCHNSDATAGNAIFDGVQIEHLKLPSLFKKGADVASATALVLGEDGNYFDVTGTTTITSITGQQVLNTMVMLHFDGILTLTHDATNLVLPGGANITTAAGDEAIFVEYAAGDWRCVSYVKASGLSVVSPTDTLYTEVYTASGTATAPSNATAVYAHIVPGAGGGGGGGGYDATNTGDGGLGGSAGAAAFRYVGTCTAGETFDVTIGAGGTAGAGGNGVDGTAGGAGGNTIFGTTTRAGGAGGAGGLYGGGAVSPTAGADCPEQYGLGGAAGTTGNPAVAGSEGAGYNAGGGGGGGHTTAGLGANGAAGLGGAVIVFWA